MKQGKVLNIKIIVLKVPFKSWNFHIEVQLFDSFNLIPNPIFSLKYLSFQFTLIAQWLEDLVETCTNAIYLAFSHATALEIHGNISFCKFIILNRPPWTFKTANKIENLIILKHMHTLPTFEYTFGEISLTTHGF